MKTDRTFLYVRILFVYCVFVIAFATAFFAYHLITELKILEHGQYALLLPLVVNIAIILAFLVPLFLRPGARSYSIVLILLVLSCLACYAIPFNFLLLRRWLQTDFKSIFCNEQNA